MPDEVRGDVGPLLRAGPLPDLSVRVLTGLRRHPSAELAAVGVAADRTVRSDGADGIAAILVSAIGEDGSCLRVRHDVGGKLPVLRAPKALVFGGAVDRVGPGLVGVEGGDTVGEETLQPGRLAGTDERGARRRLRYIADVRVRLGRERVDPVRSV